MRRRLSLPAAVLAVLCLAIPLLAGCHASSGGAQGNVLRYALQSPPTTLDPAAVQDGDTIDMLQQVFESVVKWNEKNEVVPNLAEKWDISPDGKVYTFHLRDDIYFHEPYRRKVTAQDFVYSMTRPLLPETKSPTARDYLNDIAGAQDVLDGKTKTVAGLKALDDRTFQITLTTRRPYFLAKLTYPTAYVVCREAVEKAGGQWNEAAMVGTGPFKLRAYVADHKVTLAANPEYHDGRPKLDGIERPVMTDSITRQNAYESGQLDYTDVQRADLPRVQKDPKLSAQLKQLRRANIYYLALNQQAFAPFKKKQVRQAFAMAIDKDELIRLALGGVAEPAKGILPPGIPGYDASLVGLPYDPAKARQLLAEAGYPGGKGFPRFAISFRQGYAYLNDAVQVIREDLKRNLGIECDMRQVEWSQFLKERDNGTMPCFHLRWAADYLDPQDFLSMMLRTGAQENQVGYSNPEFDKLCDEADSEEDHNKRMALYQQAQRIAVDDAPWVCLYHLPDVELQKPYLRGIRDSLMGHLPHTTTTVAR